MKDWERQVGKLIIKTGEIEFILAQLNWNLSLDEQYEDFKLPYKFSTRVKRVIKIVEKSFIEQPFKEQVLTTLNECLDISKIRNDVAHNTVYLETYIDFPFEVKQREVIGSLSGPKIKYHELCNAAEKAEDLSKRVAEIAYDQRIWNQKRDCPVKKISADTQSDHHIRKFKR